MIKSVFVAAHVCLGLLIAYVLPFVSVLRGARLKETVLRFWGLLFLYIVVLCLAIPIVVGIFSREFAREVLVSWVPEAKGVVAIAIVGWLPPLLAGSLALLIRWLIQRFRRSRSQVGPEVGQSAPL